jgi:hypothetical protein
MRFELFYKLLVSSLTPLCTFIKPERRSCCLMITDSHGKMLLLPLLSSLHFSFSIHSLFFEGMTIRILLLVLVWCPFGTICATPVPMLRNWLHSFPFQKRRRNKVIPGCRSCCSMYVENISPQPLSFANMHLWKSILALLVIVSSVTCDATLQRCCTFDNDTDTTCADQTMLLDVDKPTNTYSALQYAPLLQ